MSYILIKLLQNKDSMKTTKEVAIKISLFFIYIVSKKQEHYFS